MNRESVLIELRKIAQELNLQFDNNEVLTEWCSRNPSGMPRNIADEIFPIYTRKLKQIYGARIEDGIVTHIKRENDDVYKPVSNSVSNS